MTYLLVLPLIATSIGLFLSLQKNISLMEKLEEVGQAIEKSIDILEEQHQIIEEKTKIEVFSDEPVVRELVKDMTIAKNSVLEVAKILDDSLIEEENLTS